MKNAGGETGYEQCKTRDGEREADCLESLRFENSSEPSCKEQSGGGLRENEHPDQRPMGRFGARVAGDCAAGVGGNGFARRVGSCGLCVSGFECVRQHLRRGNCAVSLDLSDGNQLDGDCPARTRLDACWSFARGEASVAHVAFTHDATLRGIFRNVVGTFENTILAADALIIEMANDTGPGIFFVSKNRTAIEAGRVDAMMASGCDD